MAWTVTSALVGSLIFSLTLVPLLCLFLLRKKIPHEENALVRLDQEALRWPRCAGRWRIRSSSSWPRWRRSAVSLALAPRLGTEFLPELNEGTIWVNANLPAGISVEQAREYCRKMRDILRKTPEVRTVISKSGRPEDGTDPKPINMAEIFVDLKPPERVDARADQGTDLSTEMDHNLDALPGIEISFSQPIRDNVLESISQIDGQVVIKVFGDDSAALRQKAQEMLQAIADVPRRGHRRAWIALAKCRRR